MLAKYFKMIKSRLMYELRGGAYGEQMSRRYSSTPAGRRSMEKAKELSPRDIFTKKFWQILRNK